jgi:serine/threonine-protein kinase HipA
MSKKEIGYVYLNEQYVGEVHRENGEFFFIYDSHYLADPSSIPLSLSLPKSQKSYQFHKLFPFFEGLLSEGWMKRVQEKTQKIDEKDSFTRLLENGKELLGAVSVLTEKR